MRSFKDLIVWQKSHKLVLDIYLITKSFPKEELFGIVSQMRRASTSVPANIVEGYKRNTDKETLRFLNIADASLEELKYFLILSKDLNFISTEKYRELEELSNEVGRLLSGFQKSFKNRLKP